VIQSVGFFWTIAFFLLTIGPLVFFHEMGHYLVGRWCGVKADVFSIGFGREIAGWTDKRGTRWKLSMLPLGGYVRFAGDMGAASTPNDSWRAMSPDEQAVCFQAKQPWKRFLIVFAGPATNFLLAFLIYIALFATFGQRVTPSVAGQISPGSVAEQVGFKPGDHVINVDGTAISGFEDMFWVIANNPNHLMPFQIVRGGQTLTINAAPAALEEKDRFGNVTKRGYMGIAPSSSVRVPVPISQLPGVAAKETWTGLTRTVDGLWQIISGKRSVKELGGPLRIAKTSGEIATFGWAAFIAFLAMVSINLGFINLLPIPMLDGGHLVFYSIEALFGRPVSAKAQERAFMTGFYALMALMVFVTFNDLTNFGVFNRLAGLIG
jgi:regulator of sigma E protease